MPQAEMEARLLDVPFAVEPLVDVGEAKEEHAEAGKKVTRLCHLPFLFSPRSYVLRLCVLGSVSLVRR